MAKSQSRPAGFPDKPSPCFFDTSTVYMSSDVSCFGGSVMNIHTHPGQSAPQSEPSAQWALPFSWAPPTGCICPTWPQLLPRWWRTWPFWFQCFNVNSRSTARALFTQTLPQGVHPSPSLALPLWLNPTAQPCCWIHALGSPISYKDTCSPRGPAHKGNDFLTVLKGRQTRQSVNSGEFG